MDLLKLLLLALIVDECRLQNPTTVWGDRERQAALDYHNKFRGDEKACYMPPLTYSMKLEKEAKAWLLTCRYDHRYSYFGENLAKTRYKKTPKDVIIYSCQKWQKERKIYKRNRSGCGKSCHYTQMVFNSTTEVGCYVQYCTKTRDWLSACYYLPPQYLNRKPFTRVCTDKCAAHHTYRNGLCYE